MRKGLVFVLSLLSLLMAFAFCTACREEVRDERESYTVTYQGGRGGMVIGETEQSVKRGDSAQTVSAVSFEGFEFVKWSDGSENPERTDQNITQNLSVTAYFEEFRYRVRFFSEGNGTIEGNPDQSIAYNSSGTLVKAVPEIGYAFDHWSDGSTEAERVEKNVKWDYSLWAYFKEIKKTFTYEYGLAAKGVSETELELTWQKLQDYKFPVPEREHFTFQGWYLGDLQVSDELGNLTVGMKIFEQGTKFKAKWEAKEHFTFKMLLAYATEVKGSFKSLDGDEIIQVNYKMSDVERKICHLITKQVKKTLDEMMEGMVTFEVDEYFLKEPLTRENFSLTDVGWYPDVCWDPKGKDITEVVDRMPDYQGILITFCCNDWEHKLNTRGGITRSVWTGKKPISKDAEICLENLLENIGKSEDSIENFFDEEYWGWWEIVATYVHELIHILDHFSGAKVDFHEAINACYDQMIYDLKLIYKHYLWGNALLDGEYVGIPYEFWGEEERKYQTQEQNEAA